MSEVIGGEGISIMADNFALMPMEITGEFGWLMRISPHGKVEFNREEFPDLAADDFADRVMRILETFPGWNPPEWKNKKNDDNE